MVRDRALQFSGIFVESIIAQIKEPLIIEIIHNGPDENYDAGWGQYDDDELEETTSVITNASEYIENDEIFDTGVRFQFNSGSNDPLFDIDDNNAEDLLEVCRQQSVDNDLNDERDITS